MIQKIIKENLFIIAVVVVGVLIVGAVFFTRYQKSPVCVVGNGQQKISSSEISDKVIKYVNENILKGSASASVAGVSEENGLYKIKLKIQENEFDSYATLDGRFFFPEGMNMEESKTPAVEKGKTIANFSVTKEEICKDGDKPIVYFFGSQSCPHCKWEHPIVEKVAEKFNNEIVLHNNMDSNADGEIFSKYSTGGIPTLVLGCKYSRVGSGENAGEEQETKNLTALICKLTDGKPEGVCAEVKDITGQIND